MTREKLEREKLLDKASAYIRNLFRGGCILSYIDHVGPEGTHETWCLHLTKNGHLEIFRSTSQGLYAVEPTQVPEAVWRTFKEKILELTT